MAHQDRLNIAVFIDFDNVEIGVKSTLGEHFDIGTILDAIKAVSYTHLTLPTKA